MQWAFYKCTTCIFSQWYSELSLLYICICFSKTRFFFFESTVMMENLNSLAGYKYKINNMICDTKLKWNQMKPCIHVTNSLKLLLILQNYIAADYFNFNRMLFVRLCKTYMYMHGYVVILIVYFFIYRIRIYIILKKPFSVSIPMAQEIYLSNTLNHFDMMTCNIVF